MVSKQLVRSLLKSVTGVRSKKVREIRKLVKSGNYQVDTLTIAKALVSVR